MPTTTSRLIFLLLSLTLGPAPAALAQVPRAPAPEATPAAPAVPRPPVAHDSPRVAFRSFLAATRAGHLEEAARYLSLNDDNRTRGPDLAKRLDAVIDSAFQLDPEAISPAPEGRLDDELPPDVEEVARIPIDGTPEPMRLVRVAQPAGVYWVFAPATVARIDVWYGRLRTKWIRDKITAAGFPGLLREGPFGLFFYWQWVALPIIAVFVWLMSRIFRATSIAMMERVTARTANVWDDKIVASLGPPATLAFATLVFSVCVVAVDTPRPGFVLLGHIVRPVLVFAAFWALFRSAEVLSAWSMTRPWAANSASVRTLVAIGSNVFRGAIVGLGLLAMVAAFGYPVGPLLAGLGIGGLAIAIGAQKTIENVFGSISLAVDQPFRVGDFVKVEDFVGSVERIGLRSTRIRTLDRTLVSIPNGKLADQRLESFEVRDRMRLATTVRVTSSTTLEQVQTVLEGLELVLRSHPHIWPEVVVVELKEFGESSLDIEVAAWFQVSTWREFQHCRQEVLLGFMEVIERAGTRLAFPRRTVHVVREAEAPGAVAKSAFETYEDLKER